MTNLGPANSRPLGERRGPGALRLTYRRLALWLDRRGWFSTWEHAMFDFENYGSLRDQGLSHREAIAALNAEWDNRRPTA